MHTLVQMAQINTKSFIENINMKFKNRTVLICGFFVANFQFLTPSYAKEDSPGESTRSVAQAPQLKEAGKNGNQTDVQKEPPKEGGAESTKEVTGSGSQKQLPACRGSYSKVRWTECRGIRREYNGPHFIGQSYEGDFFEGRPHGHGEMRNKDGTRFVGVFEMGVRDGAGSEYTKDETLIREGFWRAGVLVKTFKTGESAREEK
jgi:hypothetical protein